MTLTLPLRPYLGKSDLPISVYTEYISDIAELKFCYEKTSSINEDVTFFLFEVIYTQNNENRRKRDRFLILTKEQTASLLNEMKHKESNFVIIEEWTQKEIDAFDSNQWTQC